MAMNGEMRTIGRVAAAGAMALLLAGAVPPAAARPRSPAPAVASGMVRGCLEMGGVPSWAERETFHTVSCLMPNDNVINCTVPVESPYPDATCDYPNG
jgi:hypothetical protein